MFNKFISDLKPTQRKILFSVAVCAILGLFYGLLLRPALSRSGQIDSLIMKEKQEVRKNMTFLSSRDKVLKETGAFKVYFTKDVKSEKEVIAELLKEVSLLANAAGIQISKTSPSGQDYQNDYLKYMVTIDCSGSMDNLTNFIFTINNSKELLKVEKMNLGANAKSADTVQATLTISKMIIGADPAVEAKSLVRVKEEKEEAKPAVAPKEE